MAKHVIILGAGASKQFGVPVMKEFLDVARDLHSAGKTGNDRERFENVFGAISSLQAVHSKSEFDLINIESIFTAFELAKTLGRFPERKSDELDQLIDDLKKLIIVTIEQTTKFRVRDRSIEAPSTVLSFLSRIRKAYSGSPFPIAVLTFNYDIIWDLALLQAGLGIDYGLAVEPNASRPVPLLKLHGSINWGIQAEDRTITPWFLRNYLSHFHGPPHHATEQLVVPIGSQIFQFAQFSGTGKQIGPTPLIVPPSWNKADSHREISKVWSKAAEELSSAESIYIIGYSLPATDSFFRHLFALGSVGRVLLKRFFVYDPDQSREDVFRSMLGPGARSRFRFFHDDTDSALDRIARGIEIEG